MRDSENDGDAGEDADARPTQHTERSAGSYGQLLLAGFRPAGGQHDAGGFVGHVPGPPESAELFRDRKAGLQSVFVEASAEMRATEPGISRSLQEPKVLLGRDRLGVEYRVLVGLAVQERSAVRRTRRAQGHEQLRVGRQVL